MQQPGAPVVVKKYSNRRLYDTRESRYVTLEELAETIRSGRDVKVVDAKSGVDLTQGTLAQIILESRRAARLLPTPLLLELIRMDDDTLTEFFQRWLSWALEIYRYSKQGAQAMAPFNPFATLPFTATNAMARLFGSAAPWSTPEPPPPPMHEPEPEPEPEPDVAEKQNKNDDIAELRAEIAALKDALLADRTK